MKLETMGKVMVVCAFISIVATIVLSVMLSQMRGQLKACETKVLVRDMNAEGCSTAWDACEAQLEVCEMGLDAADVVMDKCCGTERKEEERE